MSKDSNYKIILSDCHLSAGRYRNGKLNPFEEFHYDQEMCELFSYFSKGEYGQNEKGPVSVEIVLAGDFFDFLSVSLEGDEFSDQITESDSIKKLQLMMNAHPEVMKAIQDFLRTPGKKITYLMGNHDLDLQFEGVQKKIQETWLSSESQGELEIVFDQDRILFPDGVEVHHGHQFEQIHFFEYDEPFRTTKSGKKVLNIPWGSSYILKVMNYLKLEKHTVDKIRPIRSFILLGFLFDPLFTIKFLFLSTVYFFKTRLGLQAKDARHFKRTWEMIKAELQFFPDMEEEAQEYLVTHPELKTLICGHTHLPANRIFQNGQQFINTGTWTKMIHLDLHRLGEQAKLTFAWIKYIDGVATCDLRYWVGEHSPHHVFNN